VKTKAGRHAFTLGAAEAALWIDKIKNPPSRLAKLGVKPATKIAIEGQTAAPADFLAETKANVAPPPADLVFLFLDGPRDLARKIAAARKKGAALWIVRAKGKGASPSESEVREAARDAGLIDVKVCAFSETLTADKYIPREP
jgi:hypothetical protein